MPEARSFLAASATPSIWNGVSAVNLFNCCIIFAACSAPPVNEIKLVSKRSRSAALLIAAAPKAAKGKLTFLVRSLPKALKFEPKRLNSLRALPRSLLSCCY